MPTCENCSNKWSWKQTVIKTTTLDPAMICPYCGEKQYQTQKSKNKGGLLTGIVVFLMLLIANLFDMPLAGTLGLLPVLIAIILLIYPYLVELSSTEKYINFFRDKR
ncbi:TIGR04104 family putative zinc finger protein [Virgibacillus sp. CBA3643]|uniref:TIGR04104 family putative zinc finger protein n=1 Tax=Virgibacillus sp. CBA3643 TaxID=2942278 RepID=UPI0035A2B1FF